jgi:serine/threonine protein kinase
MIESINSPIGWINSATSNYAFSVASSRAHVLLWGMADWKGTTMGMRDEGSPMHQREEHPQRRSGTRPAVREPGFAYAGRFTHATRVDSGAMGTVYKATDEQSGELVALKVLRHMEWKDRFLREAQVLATMRHERIVRYVDHGIGANGDPWLAMEWLEGEDLAKRLVRGPLGVRDTLTLAKNIAQALSWAHDHGFIHRDIKPSNLFLPRGELGRIKVLDFGLARLAAEAVAITATGTLMGTLEYMPPEQALDAKRADSRSDVYSLGAVLFHCLAGQTAVCGKTVSESLARLLSGEPLPIGLLPAETPSELVDLLLKMLAKDMRQRPRDGTAVLDALARISVEPAWESLTTLPVAMQWDDRTSVAPTVPRPRPVPVVVRSSSTPGPSSQQASPSAQCLTRRPPLPEVTMRMPSAPAWPATAPKPLEERGERLPRPLRSEADVATEVGARSPIIRRGIEREFLTYFLLFVATAVIVVAFVRALH